MSRKNKEYCTIKKAPAGYCKGYELGNRDLNDPTQTPEKQGSIDNADNATAYFAAYQDYFNQILTMFDRLTPDEQSALLDALQARVHGAEEMSR